MNVNMRAPKVGKMQATPPRRVWLRYLVLSIVAPIGAGILALVASQHRTLVYESEAALIVTFGEEYISRPLAGEGESWSPWSEQVAVNSEMAILNSETLRDQVIERVGIDAIARARAAESEIASDVGFFSSLRSSIKSYALNWGLVEKVDETEVARREWDRSLNIKGVKETSTIYVAYRSPSPEIAARVVHSIVATYFDIRRSIFAKPDNDYLRTQLSLWQSQYEQAIREMKEFEAVEGGGDFVDIIARASETIASLEEALSDIERDIASQMGSLAAREVAGASTGATLQDALRSNAAIAGLQAKRDKAVGQLEVAQARLQTLMDKSVSYEMLGEKVESAREAYRNALELTRKAEIDSVLADLQYSNVKVLHSGGVPLAPINLPVRVLVILSGVLTLVSVIAVIVLFAGRGGRQAVR